MSSLFHWAHGSSTFLHFNFKQEKEPHDNGYLDNFDNEFLNK
jgi:hypothetical protein